MKNKLKLLMTVVTASVIGCEGRDVPVDPELVCRDREVMVNHAAAYLSAHPEYIKICPGYSIVITIAPPVEAESAKTAAAGERSAPWLNGTNEGRDRIVLRVPDEKGIEGEYKYSITIDGVGTLDPRVTVERR